jgi:ATP-dependent DNA ligase
MLRSRTAVAGFIEPCLPSLAKTPPSGPDWLHEIKHDGYRMMIRRDAAGARLFTRRGYDWTTRYPAIVAAANTIRAKLSFVIDGGGTRPASRPGFYVSLLRAPEHAKIVCEANGGLSWCFI